MLPNKVYDRPRRLIGDKAYDKINSLVIGIAGIGVLGNPLVAELSRIGVREIRLLDKDEVNEENLANTFLLNLNFIGMGKDKAGAKIARNRALKSINIKPYHFDITDVDNLKRVLKFVKGLDLLFGCLDNVSARFTLSSIALVCNVKYVDLGIEGYAGRIRFIDRSRACYNCNPLVPEHEIINIYKLTKDEGDCDYAPTVTILPVALATTSYAVLEGMKFLGILGKEPTYDYIYYNFLESFPPIKMRITKKDDCVICGKDGMIWWPEECFLN